MYRSMYVYTSNLRLILLLCILTSVSVVAHPSLPLENTQESSLYMVLVLGRLLTTLSRVIVCVCSKINPYEGTMNGHSVQTLVYYEHVPTMFVGSPA